MMDSDMLVIAVDARCRDSNGDNFLDVAAPNAVAAGFIVNVPVLLRYPDGHQVRATQVRVMPKGIEEMSRAMGLNAGRRQ